MSINNCTELSVSQFNKVILKCPISLFQGKCLNDVQTNCGPANIFSIKIKIEKKGEEKMVHKVLLHSVFGGGLPQIMSLQIYWHIYPLPRNKYLGFVNNTNYDFIPIFEFSISIKHDSNSTVLTHKSFLIYLSI